MANRPAPALSLRDGDREELARWTRSSSTRAGLAQRARIVLLAADGSSNTEIADKVGVSRPTVISWRKRYQDKGIDGLVDQERSGRPRHIDHREIVSATLTPPPKKYGVTHWSTRLLAKHLSVGDATIARAWREYGVQPWRSQTFKFSTDPELEAARADLDALFVTPADARRRIVDDARSGVGRDPGVEARSLEIERRGGWFAHPLLWLVLLAAGLSAWSARHITGELRHREVTVAQLESEVRRSHGDTVPPVTGAAAPGGRSGHDGAPRPRGRGARSVLGRCQSPRAPRLLEYWVSEANSQCQYSGL